MTEMDPRMIRAMNDRFAKGGTERLFPVDSYNAYSTSPLVVKGYDESKRIPLCLDYYR